MMHNRFLLLSIVMFLACSLLPERAQAQMGVGIVLWRHATNLEIERATDFDGTDDTADMRTRKWDMQGSGVGLRVTREFTRLMSIYGLAGLAQVTVRDEDVTDPNLDLDSHGFDDGFYLALGARVGDDFSSNDNLFWSSGLSFNIFSSDVDEAVDRAWEYEESSFMVDGTMGYKVQGVGLYGGLRVVWYSADLQETDATKPLGQRLRTTKLEREGQIDLMVGAQTHTQRVAGFVEVGVIGSFSTTTGLTFKF